MNTTLTIIAAVIGIMVAALIQLILHIQERRRREQAIKFREEHRRLYPEVAALWNNGEVTSDENPPLRQVPPNVGGEGKPDYRGPNYVSDEEVADEMKGLKHFYAQPATTTSLDAARAVILDLAFEWEPGHVAADGTIWGDTRGERWKAGEIMIPWSEQRKAARFGWELVGDGHKPGTCIVRRPHRSQQ